MLKFTRLLAPIYSSIYLTIDDDSKKEVPKKKLSKRELIQLIRLFKGKVQWLEYNLLYNDFPEFYKHYAFIMKDLTIISIYPEITEQVEICYF